jgi:hypothetical protein
MILIHPTLASSPKLLRIIENNTQCIAIWVKNNICQLVPANKNRALSEKGTL